MCLNRLKKFKTNGVGWKKIFIEYGDYTGICTDYVYKKRGWNKEDNGFYLFVGRKDARKDCLKCNAIKKVQYRGVIDTGYVDESKVVVAKEFRFIKDK